MSLNMPSSLLVNAAPHSGEKSQVSHIGVCVQVHLSHQMCLRMSRADGLNGPCFSFDSIDFSASTEALFPTSSLFARSFL